MEKKHTHSGLCGPAELKHKDECSPAPAGIGSKVYISKPNSLGHIEHAFHAFEISDEKGTAEKGTGFLAKGSFKTEVLNKKFRRRYFPTRLPRKEKKRRKKETEVTGGVPVLNLAPDGCNFILLLHGMTPLHAIPVHSDREMARWMNWINRMKKKNRGASQRP